MLISMPTVIGLFVCVSSSTSWVGVLSASLCRCFALYESQGTVGCLSELRLKPAGPNLLTGGSRGMYMDIDTGRAAGAFSCMGIWVKVSNTPVVMPRVTRCGITTGPLCPSAQTSCSVCGVVLVVVAAALAMPGYTTSAAVAGGFPAAAVFAPIAANAALLARLEEGIAPTCALSLLYLATLLVFAVCFFSVV